MRLFRLSAVSLATVAGVALAILPMAHAHAAANVYANGDAPAGAKLVQAHGCTSCHGAKLTGAFAPKLVGIEQHLTAEQIADKIKNPSPPMPNFGFSDTQVADLVAYLSTLDGGKGKSVANGTQATTK